ncbi:MAG: sugar phosphate nucleotidyltransferase [Chlorobium phaeovibrioides]|nr:sugar phosphate nucleotidyltransferase [Chlorobium phaeovibrioides]
MAGGSGSRLWPLSRLLKPKQFLALSNQKETMLQATLARIDNLPNVQLAEPLLLCNEEHRFLAAEQMRSMGYEHPLLLQILEDRYGKLAVIITSQLPVAQWHDVIGEPTIADGIMDRLLGNAHSTGLFPVRGVLFFRELMVPVALFMNHIPHAVFVDRCFLSGIC